MRREEKREEREVLFVFIVSPSLLYVFPDCTTVVGVDTEGHSMKYIVNQWTNHR